MVMYKWLDLHSAYILPIIYRKGQAVFFIRVLHNPYTGVSGFRSCKSVKVHERSDDTPESWKLGGRSSTEQTKGRLGRCLHPHKALR